MTRIAPLDPPYSAEAAELLASMMPAGVPPIALFRTFARNLPMTAAMRGWGSYELGRSLSLTMRDREVLILRTCARCGCEYEWGVHVAFFADRVGLTAAQIASITHGDAGDPCWTDDRDRVLLECADALHESSDLDDDVFTRATAVLDEAQVLDLVMLCGWYHAISYAANVARVAAEPGAPRFASVA